ncbi:MAG: hypothetical protein M1814_003884 [Vezdaea aestivalis]|nr:MAG: hypothetical protein M1814_003884 [Vezdaea aestivalis]
MPALIGLEQLCSIAITVDKYMLNLDPLTYFVNRWVSRLRPTMGARSQRQISQARQIENRDKPPASLWDTGAALLSRLFGGSDSNRIESTHLEPEWSRMNPGLLKRWLIVAFIFELHDIFRTVTLAIPRSTDEAFFDSLEGTPIPQELFQELEDGRYDAVAQIGQALYRAKQDLLSHPNRCHVCSLELSELCVGAQLGYLETTIHRYGYGDGPDGHHQTAIFEEIADYLRAEARVQYGSHLYNFQGLQYSHCRPMGDIMDFLNNIERGLVSLGRVNFPIYRSNRREKKRQRAEDEDGDDENERPARRRR